MNHTVHCNLISRNNWGKVQKFVTISQCGKKKFSHAQEIKKFRQINSVATYIAISYDKAVAFTKFLDTKNAWVRIPVISTLWISKSTFWCKNFVKSTYLIATESDLTKYFSKLALYLAVFSKLFIPFFGHFCRISLWSRVQINSK